MKHESSKFCCPRSQEYHKTLLLLPLAHSLGVTAAADRPSLDEEDANVPHLVDGITEPVNVKLYIRQEWIKDKVALGQAWPAGDGIINGHPIPLVYGCITIDRILDKKYNKIPIEYPVAEDRPKLDQNKGSQIAWRKRFIKLDRQLSSDDEDDC